MAEPTRPRRPIAAMHKGPGPVYALQGVTGWDNHCQTKRRLPAYSMCGRGKQFYDECSPGPKYLIEKGFTRVGPDGAAKVGISGRHKDLTSFQTPSPAPNAYSLPSTLGEKLVDKRTNPCYSIQSRSKQGGFAEDLTKTPGPGTYKVTDPGTYKQAPPKYSMTSRNVAPGDTTVKPGPGAHKPEDVKMHKRKAPEFSFGIRHSEYTAPLIVEPVDC